MLLTQKSTIVQYINVFWRCNFTTMLLPVIRVTTTCFNNILITFQNINGFAINIDSFQVLVKMWILLLLLSVCSETVICYSDGKVEAACGDMTPQHGHDPRTKNPPFNLTADKSQFSPGDEIKGRNTVAEF